MIQALQVNRGKFGQNVSKRTYVAAIIITNDKQKRILLLYQAGEAMQEIFEKLPETEEDYATAQAKLDEYFSPKTTKYFNFAKQSSSQVKPWINVSQSCKS